MKRTPRALLLAALALGAACSPKPPKTTPPAPAPTAVEAPRTTEVPPVPPDPTPQGLPQDLVELNAYVEREGLLGDVYYELDSANLGEAARERLARNARFLDGHRDLEVAIEGHCDERGTNEYNLALGERRASAAGGYLANLGVDGERLRTISLGEERPQCSQSAEGCWGRNRRAHFVITGRRAA